MYQDGIFVSNLPYCDFNKKRGGGGLGYNQSFWNFFFICQRIWVCVSVLFPRIEPVGKP